jgi:hypothetical protein
LLGLVFQLCIQNQQQQDDDQDNDNLYIDNITTTSIVTVLQALQAWCTVTDLLSIAQVQHFFTRKVKVGTPCKGCFCFCMFVGTVCWMVDSLFFLFNCSIIFLYNRST